MEKLNNEKMELIREEHLERIKNSVLLETLGKNIEIISGIIPSRYESENNHGTHYDCISSKAISNGYINDDEIDKHYLDVGDKNYDIIDNRLSRIDDIIIKTSLPCNAVLITEEYKKHLITTNCIIIRGITDINKEYLVAYLNSNLFQNGIRKNCKKGTVSLLTVQKVREFPILNLSKEEQSLIGEYFEKLSKKEALFKKIVSLEHERIEALIKRGEDNGTY